MHPARYNLLAQIGAQCSFSIRKHRCCYFVFFHPMNIYHSTMKEEKKKEFLFANRCVRFLWVNPTRLEISIKLNTLTTHKICRHRRRYIAMGDTLLLLLFSFNVFALHSILNPTLKIVTKNGCVYVIWNALEMQRSRRRSECIRQTIGKTLVYTHLINSYFIIFVLQM